MPTFTYSARDLQGIDHKGTIETVDHNQAARILAKRGLIVIAIDQKKDQQSTFFSKFFNRVSFSDLVIATRQLATMIESGLVLSEALDILVEQQSNKQFKTVLGDVSRDVKGGIDLATAFRKHPNVFPPLYASLISSGEQSGKLDVVLTQMASSLEKDREFRARIKGAMIYPIMILVMMIVVMLIMLLFVVPRLTSLYSQSNIDLPLPTKILILVSSFLVNFWWMMVIFTIVGVILFRRWIATPTGKYKFDTLLLRIPVVSKVIQDTTLTNFTRTFGLLVTEIGRASCRERV